MAGRVRRSWRFPLRRKRAPGPRPAQHSDAPIVGASSSADSRRELRRSVTEALFDGAWERAFIAAVQVPDRSTWAVAVRAWSHLAVEQPFEVVSAELLGSTLQLRLRWPAAVVIDELRIRIAGSRSGPALVVSRPPEAVGEVAVALRGTDLADAYALLEPSSSLLRGMDVKLPDACCTPVALN